MFGSSLLEVVIGLAFMFTLLSLTCSSINELIAQYTKRRAKNLELALTRMLGERHVHAFYEHPLLRSLSKVGDGPSGAEPTARGVRPSPSYIPASTTSTIILQIIGRAQSDEERSELQALRGKLEQIEDPGFVAIRARVFQTFEPIYACEGVDEKQLDALLETVRKLERLDALREPVVVQIERFRTRVKSASELDAPSLYRRVQRLEDGDPLKRTLLALMDSSNGTLAGIRANIEGWYDDVMDRASGWYKRKTQRWMLGIAAALVLLGNVDSLAVADMLWRENTARALIANYAEISSMIQTGQVSANNSVNASANANPNASANPADPNANPEDDADGDGVPDGAVQAPPQPVLVDMTRDPLALYTTGFPVGWKLETLPTLLKLEVLSKKLAGLLISLLAAAQGAPFWFDLLNKLVNLRGSGRRPSANQAPPNS
ncbi:MAG: hypothetical protein H6713_22040 [Myxococcales bacterium]|nr:hypothetical protein [Myxococcales bacterium]